MSSSNETPPQEPDLSPKQELRREIGEFVKMIIWFLILFYVVRSYVIEGYEVQGPSMIPTLNDRERILVLKLPHTLSEVWLFRGINAIDEGDIVVFDSPVEPAKRYVKRVIAKGPARPGSNTVDAGRKDAAPDEGPLVRFDRGAVYVNNKRLAEDYLTAAQRHGVESFDAVRVGPGTYYVMGDNRSVSKDSRRFGPVSDEHVVGKALVCFWPPSHIRILQ